MGGSGGITTTVGWAGYSDTSGMIDYSRRKLCFISVELIECFHLAELHITNYWGSCFHSLMTAPVVSHYRHRGICWFSTDCVRAAAPRTDHNSVLLELKIESQLTMDDRYTSQRRIRLTILTSLADGKSTCWPRNEASSWTVAKIPQDVQATSFAGPFYWPFSINDAG